VASNTILASYGGDTSFNGSISNTVTQVVNAASKTNSSSALVSSLNPSNSGQSVKFTATVTPASGTTVPTGSVSFADGATSLGSPVALDSTGKATLTTSTLTVNSHIVSASYTGDTNFNGSISNTLSQVVNAQVVGDFSVSVQESSLTLTAGQTGTLHVTITPQNGFNQTVAMGCSGLPVRASCGPASVTLDGVHAASTTVSVLTMTNASVPGAPRSPALPVAPWFVPIGIVSLAIAVLVSLCPRRHRMRAILTCGVICIAIGLVSCSSTSSGGGGTSKGTPPGTYALTITGASGAIVHNALSTVTLMVN
jgi:hypothetical protein